MFLTVEEKHCDPVDRSSLGGGRLYSKKADLMRGKLDAETPPLIITFSVCILAFQKTACNHI